MNLLCYKSSNLWRPAVRQKAEWTCFIVHIKIQMLAKDELEQSFNKKHKLYIYIIDNLSLYTTILYIYIYNIDNSSLYETILYIYIYII